MDAPRDETGDEAVAAFLEAALLADLRAESPQGLNSRLTLTIRNGGAIVAGLDGSTAYGWLLIKVLWVDARFRGRGLGRRLMEMADEEALRRGCHALWLDTSSAKAFDFYSSLGFEAFGELKNGPQDQPPGHRRRFMRARAGALTPLSQARTAS